MARWTALCLVFALATASASRLACVWECVDTHGEAHAAAPCHEAPSHDPTMAASPTHCPLAPAVAAPWVAKSYESQRTRVAPAPAALPAPFDALRHATADAHAAGAEPLSPPGTASRTHVILRI